MEIFSACLRPNKAGAILVVGSLLSYIHKIIPPSILLRN